jgi:hypothetical protein
MMAVLCLAILAISIGLYAITQAQIDGCKNYCNKHYGDSTVLYSACFDGCTAKYMDQ